MEKVVDEAIMTFSRERRPAQAWIQELGKNLSSMPWLMSAYLKLLFLNPQHNFPRGFQPRCRCLPPDSLLQHCGPRLTFLASPVSNSFPVGSHSAFFQQRVILVPRNASTVRKVTPSAACWVLSQLFQYYRNIHKNCPFRTKLLHCWSVFTSVLCYSCLL